LHAVGRKRQPNLALFFVFILCFGIFLLWMYVCFYSVRFSFSVLSQEMDWEERLWNDLFCVRWDVKPWFNQSVQLVMDRQTDMICVAGERCGYDVSMLQWTLWYVTWWVTCWRLSLMVQEWSTDSCCECTACQSICSSMSLNALLHHHTTLTLVQTLTRCPVRLSILPVGWIVTTISHE